MKVCHFDWICTNSVFDIFFSFFFLQALHFFYGLGAFISPIVAEPFILNEDCTPLINNSTVGDEPIIPIERRDVAVTESVDEGGSFDTLEEAREKTHVKFAFWIMAMIQVSIEFVFQQDLMRPRNDDTIVGAWWEDAPQLEALSFFSSCLSVRTQKR